MQSAFILINFVVVLVSMAILSGRTSWKSVLLLLAANSLIALLLVFIGMQLLAVIIVSAGILGQIALFALAIRTNRIKRQPVPFKRYNRFVSVVAIVGLLGITSLLVMDQIHSPTPLPVFSTPEIRVFTDYEDLLIWLPLVTVFLACTLVGLAGSSKSEA